MRIQIIVILLVIAGIATVMAQISEEHISIIVTSEGKVKISQTLSPKTFVSSIDVNVISDKISNILAKDEKSILLGTTQNSNLLKIATLGASSVDLKYNADILSYESGIFKLRYDSDVESRVSLPPLSKLVSINTIPIEITEKEYVLPPGEISLSYTVSQVTSKEFFVNVKGAEQRIETISAARIDEMAANTDEIQFIIKDKAIVLTVIPKELVENPDSASLNGGEVNFSQFYQNATHSWIRIEPHEKGLVKIIDSSKKSSEGGGCLIATATYGTELAPQVQFLREVRDDQLLKTNAGASFMTGFNQLYYSFSPTIADFERENPVFKDIVKIGITPMVSSLFIMNNAQSESEIIGFGAIVILINVVMYVLSPVGITYYVMKKIRTLRTNDSNRSGIFFKYVHLVLKTSLFGIIVLVVLSVSVSSVFLESAYAEGEEPIKMILDITYQNILDSMEAAEENPNDNAWFKAAEEKYFDALAALESGDIVGAKEDALVAMSLFEDAMQEIGTIEEQSSILPPGYGKGLDSASDTGIIQGQGLGVGDVPPGILKQITASSMFEVQEEITDVDQEVKELRNLIESNNLNVNLDEYDKSINLAKEVLVSGQIPDAKTQLEVAKQIKDDLYEQINTAIAEKQDERVQQFVENSKNNIEEMLAKSDNLGLTKKAISELESVLESIENGDINDVLEKTNDNSELSKELENIKENPVNSENAPGQNREENAAPGNSENAPGQNREENAAPGNSENAPGQNKGNEETPLPPGSGAAGDNPSANGIENGNGLGLGKVPPGLAKLFGYNDGTGEDKEFKVPEGFGAAGDNPSANGIENGNGLGLGNIPPGQLKKFESYESSFEQSPDDFYENDYEASIDGVFEINFDGTNKGNGEGKGQFGAFPGRTGVAPGSLIADEKSNGKKPFCAGKGIGGKPVILLNGPSTVLLANGGTYTELGARACDVDVSEITDLIVIGGSVNTNIDGAYTITYDVTSPKPLGNSANTVSRTVIVGEINPIFEVLDMNGNKRTVDFTTTVDIGDPHNDDTYNLGTIQNIIDDKGTDGGVVVDASSIGGTVPAVGTYTVTYTVTDDDLNATTITETVEVCNGTCGTAPGKPTGVGGVAAAGPSINVSWTAPVDDGGSAITGYKIERNRQGTGAWTVVVADTGDASTAYNDNTISSLESYRYRISAINAIGTGAVSNASVFIAVP